MQLSAAYISLAAGWREREAGQLVLVEEASFKKLNLTEKKKK